MLMQAKLKLIDKIRYFRQTEPAAFVVFLVMASIILVMNSYYTDHFFNQPKAQLHTPESLKKPAAREAAQKTDTTPITTPAGLQTVAAWQHTDQIGTPDHPTLDGGIINAADGMPVYHPPTVKNTPVKAEEATANHKDSNEENQTTSGLADDWATSGRIKTILEKAAQTGKLDYVLNQSEQKHLPASVALLPIIESAYQDNALSPKGAAGAWQLMPETAKENGITAQARTDFIPSTQAALNYLQALHQQFGNWTLAYAAYNAGQGRVMKALNKNPSATSITQLDLPQETKNYVTSLMRIDHALVQTTQGSEPNL